MWHGIHGHDDVVEQFRRAIARGRLASSFLFVGPSGIGKRTFALKLAQTLLCATRPEAAMDPCGECPSCVQAAAGSHPDLDRIGKPDGKSSIPLELLIGDAEHRRREGLCHNISLKPFFGRRKIAVIDDADDLNAEGANALLKTLEEPPPRSVLILIGTTPAKQLPTIRSRCQLIRFQPLSTESVAELLVSRELVADPAEARRLARHSEGSLQRAMELADADLWTFCGELHKRLAAPRPDGLGLAQAVAAFVDAAGKEAPARRRVCGKSWRLPPISIAGFCWPSAAGRRRRIPTCKTSSIGPSNRAPKTSASRPPGWIVVYRPPPRSIATPIRRP